MNRFILAAGSGCALLFAIIVTELVSNMAPAPDASAPRNASMSLASADVAAANVEEAVRVIESRPLFNRNRQPMKSDAPARPTLAASSFNRRLTGVVIEAEKRAAIFSGEGGNNRGIVVPEGAQIEGWFVQSVTPTNVTLVTAGQSQVLELIRNKSKLATTSSTPTSAPAPTALSLIPSFMHDDDVLHFESALAAPLPASLPPPSLPPRP